MRMGTRMSVGKRGEEADCQDRGIDVHDLTREAVARIFVDFGIGRQCGIASCFFIDKGAPSEGI